MNGKGKTEEGVKKSDLVNVGMVYLGEKPNLFQIESSKYNVKELNIHIRIDKKNAMCLS